MPPSKTTGYSGGPRARRAAFQDHGQDPGRGVPPIETPTAAFHPWPGKGIDYTGGPPIHIYMYVYGLPNLYIYMSMYIYAEGKLSVKSAFCCTDEG